MAHRFSGAAADAYDAGRAPYVPAVVAALDLPAPPSTVLDLAAGTGLLSRALLAAGHAVVAVEPDADMASRLPAGVKHRSGTAEATGLDDESLDAAVVGDAWHWFDAPAAADELRRVLRPRARLALLWRFSDPEQRPEALAGYFLLLADAHAEQPALDPDRGRDALAAHAGFSPLLHRRVAFVHRTSHDGLLAEAASTSFVNALEDRAGFLDELAGTLVGVGKIDIPYVADIWLTRRRR
jgi:SAM-dependent methyltransferase